jgi:glucose dehydrogenase
MGVIVALTGVALVVAGAVVLGGAWAAVVAGVTLIILGLLVDWERLS